MRTHTFFTAFTLLAAAPACDANVDAGYQGEPLLTLRGEVAKPDQAPAQDLDVVVAWFPFKVHEGYMVAQKAAIEGSFPASFALDLYTAPDASMLSEFDENDPGFAIAYIFAVPAGTDLAQFGAEEEPPVAGVVETHLLVYAAGDLPEDHDTVTFGIFPEPLKAGFHLFQATPKTEAELMAIEACHAGATSIEEEVACGHIHDTLVPVPFDTPLVLTLGDEDQLHFPEFL
ncbi:hypothetical protein SAMN02745121_01168 [Nannocystis exedens]|uniref:Spondin_N n=1 Tax=Nannocystis exedens TaxID=54 RepID=A0A1I1UDE8_9BACT|nr:hypothetical protein [Nannocystis exedens]PCC71625.1 hypothetical protein NAEX_04702 [Nannocystis exedens]SFD68862.1 hypothetical protein SAMN02745121_01168 [Nannocystis exedens]